MSTVLQRGQALNRLRQLLPNAVLLPLPKGKKSPTGNGWQNTTFGQTREPEYTVNLRRIDDRGGNCGVLLGPPSSHLVVIDIDDDNELDGFLALNPRLAKTMRTKGMKGGAFWVVILGDYPARRISSKKKIGDTPKPVAEWRGGGGVHQVIYGQHPDLIERQVGKPYHPLYRFTVETKPIEIAFTGINWPVDWGMVFEDAPPTTKTDAAAALPPVSIDPNRDKLILAYLDKMPEAIDGEGGSNITFRVANFLVRGCAMDKPEARRWMDYYSAKCKPPWKEKEIEHKLDDALKAPQTKPQGWFWIEHERREQGRLERLERERIERLERLERLASNGTAAKAAPPAALEKPIDYEPGCEEESPPPPPHGSEAYQPSADQAKRADTLRKLAELGRNLQRHAANLANDPALLLEELREETEQLAKDQEPERNYIELLAPSQILAYQPPPNLMLVGDNHIVRGNVQIIGGPPGVGKSRALLALAEAGATKYQWFGLTTHDFFRTLIIQSENSLYRLRAELSEINEPKLEEYLRICPPPQFGLCFSKTQFRDQLRRFAEEFKPQVVGIDPWSAVAQDDKLKDYAEAFELIRDVFPPGDQGPAIVIVAHTRKPAQQDRNNGRALLNLLAGSYLVGATPRCVWVMQHASDDVAEERVVWTCCKNNDGELGPRGAWVRQNGLFGPAHDFDWTSWDGGEDQGAIPVQKVVDRVRTHPDQSQAQLVAWIKTHGVSKNTAYRRVEEAENRRLIKSTKNGYVVCD